MGIFSGSKYRLLILYDILKLKTYPLYKEINSKVLLQVHMNCKMFM